MINIVRTNAMTSERKEEGVDGKDREERLRASTRVGEGGDEDAWAG